jgi:hypothetical protein
LLVLFLDTEVPEMVFVGANVIIAIFCPLWREVIKYFFTKVVHSATAQVIYCCLCLDTVSNK